MKTFFTIVLLLLAPSLALAKDSLPPEHYVDKGACPFEGCTYKEWTVNTKTAFHKNMDANSPILFYADKGEVVTGLTGAVVTTKLGTAKVLKPLTIGQVKTKPGDIIYTISFSMESMKLWVKGNVIDTYIEMIPIDEKNISADYAENLSVKEISEPETEWWVKVKNSKGQIGWTIADKNFDHMDSLE